MHLHIFKDSMAVAKWRETFYQMRKETYFTSIANFLYER